MSVDWDSFSSVTNRLLEFSSDRSWTDLHSAEQLSKALIVEAAELLEIFLWKAPDEGFDEAAAKNEIADVLIYAILTCVQLNASPGELIARKLSVNEERFSVTD